MAIEDVSSIQSTRRAKRKSEQKIDPKIEKELIPFTIKASRSELAEWRRKAVADNRSLSSWIRLRLLASDTLDAARAVDVAEGEYQ
jgi:hypothetical protein